MLCKLCNVDKLSNEFPLENVSDECDHPSLVCMRCVLCHVKKNNQCPYQGCSVSVQPESQIIQVFEATLKEMFTEYETTYTPPVEIGAGSASLKITMLTGDSMSLPYIPTMTIQQLKGIIQREWKHDVSKQKLIYEESEMKTYDAGSLLRLSDYNFKPNSTVFLLVILYAIPENFDHVVFDLFWGYPFSGRDYLDASCLVYQSSNRIGLCDYRHHNWRNSVTHSGDVMDDFNRKGHHTIHVHLKKLPTNASHLYFTLSAWNSPSISRYPNPSLRFYDANNPNTDLCKTTFTHAGHSQAVIMCSVSRNSDGIWQIFESGRLSAGNAKKYNPLDATIAQLIKSGF